MQERDWEAAYKLICEDCYNDWPVELVPGWGWVHKDGSSYASCNAAELRNQSTASVKGDPFESTEDEREEAAAAEADGLYTKVRKGR